MEYYFSTYDIMRLAAQVEAKGLAFYRHLQADSSDRKMSDMWAFLAEQEQQHEAKFLATAEAYNTSADEKSYAVNIQEMLKTSIQAMAKFMDDRIASGQTPVNVSESLALAAELEATAIRVYTHMMRVYADRFSEVLGSALDEEREHLRMIRSVQHRLGLPSAEKETQNQ